MIRYFFRDGSAHAAPHYAGARDLHRMIEQARRAAAEEMARAGTSHAVYAVKRYDPETDAVEEAVIYCPAVALDDDEFYKRTEEEAKKNPGSLILALHAMN